MLHPRAVQETFEDADDCTDEDDSDLGDTVAIGGALILCRTFGSLALIESGLVLATNLRETSRLYRYIWDRVS